MRGRFLGPLVGGVLGAVAARAAYSALRSKPPGDEKLWARTNHRGEPVTLLEGPAFCAGAATASLLTPGVPGRVRAAAAIAAAGAGALGAYDDLAGSGSSRGFKGHLSALARGEVTSGAVKLLGIGATGLVSAAVAGGGAVSGGAATEAAAGTAPARTRGAADTLIDGALIAGTANLLNLFDLRPGRAIKVGLLAGVPALLAKPRGDAGPAVAAATAAAPLGAAAALLPEDLGERAMLGDAGANALGALLGVAATTIPSRRLRLALLGGVTALTAASEVVSFTKVIEATPPLRRLDELGRRPRESTPPAAWGPDEAEAEPYQPTP